MSALLLLFFLVKFDDLTWRGTFEVDDERTKNLCFSKTKQEESNSSFLSSALLFLFLLVNFENLGELIKLGQAPSMKKEPKASLSARQERRKKGIPLEQRPSIVIHVLRIGRTQLG